MKRYLVLVEDPGPIEARDKALILALDRLALAYHFAEAPWDSRDHPCPARAGYQVLRKRIAPLFPHYGLYDDISEVSERVGEPEVGVGDAIDDLTDIAMELHEVLARWETTSEEDALWHLRFSFESHWGQHLRSLQGYLHSLVFC